MNYEQACSEMNFILNNLKLEDLEKIPKSFIQFFANNMDSTYQVNIDLNKPLYEQNLLEETKAFIKIIQINYFTLEENRSEKIAELGLDDVNENYSYENLFKNGITNNNSDIKTVETAENTSLIKYKDENKIVKFFKNLFSKFFRKK